MRGAREESLIIKHFAYSLAWLREKSYHKPILDFSKAVSFSEVGLPEVLFRIMVFVPFSMDIRTQRVLVLEEEASPVSSVNS